MDDFVNDNTPPPTVTLSNFENPGKTKIESQKKHVTNQTIKELPDTHAILMQGDYEDDSPPVDAFDEKVHLNFAEERKHLNKPKTGREFLNCNCCMKCGVAFGHCFLVGFISALGLITSISTLYGFFWCGFKSKEIVFDEKDTEHLMPITNYIDKPLPHFFGIFFGAIYLYFVLLFFISYYQTALTNNKPCPYPHEYYGPGGAGEKDPIESRYPVCRKCGRIKPPRAHHDSLSNACYPKMDHRCPMSANIIAWDNYGYFVRFITWGSIDTAFSILLQIVSLLCGVYFKSITDFSMKLLFSLMSIMFSFISCATVISISSMHIPMILRNETTIESFDNDIVKKEAEKKGWEFIYPYSLGKKENIKQVFGINYRRSMFTPCKIIPYGDPMKFVEKPQLWGSTIASIGEIVNSPQKKEKINKMPSLFEEPMNENITNNYENNESDNTKIIYQQTSTINDGNYTAPVITAVNKYQTVTHTQEPTIENINNNLINGKKKKAD